MQKTKLNKRGFTLIELLIVIGILGIIAAVVFVALDPGTRFADARNSRRWTDISAIVDAIKVDQVDNGGALEAEIAGMTATEVYMITDGVPGSPDCDAQNAYCTTNVTVETVAGDHCVNLAPLAAEGYIGKVPVGPNGNGTWTADITGYTLSRDANNIITVRSCDTENTGDEITIVR
jgi:prepilin-type N-terminal cleavage/methylation domain-containing protein